MLSREFHTFYNRWRAKANHYHGGDIRAAFDRFFTLYVIYNRLYAEATFELDRQPDSGVSLAQKRSFPDGPAARIYVGKYLGSAYLSTIWKAIRLARELLTGSWRSLKNEDSLSSFIGLLERGSRTRT